jgi:Domain of unknown function (DUF1942)
VNIKRLRSPLAAAVTLGIVAATVAPARAINDIKPFGVQATLKNYLFNTEIGYTVDNLAPSTDPVAHPVQGALYESTATVKSISGVVVPVIPFFNARAENGENYRVLAHVSTLSGGALLPGAQSTGKLYFDVVGDAPNSVVFSDGRQDLLGWVAP